MLPYGYDGDFVNYANGTYRWKAYGGNSGGPPALSTADRGHDMWHAALNGRGQFYAVEKGEDLKKAFEAIIGTINTETQPDLTSTATSGANNTRNVVGKFTGAYEPSNAWKGFVKAETVQTDGTLVPTPGWSKQTTADKLDDPSYVVGNRLILSWSDVWNKEIKKYKGGTEFQWSNDETYLSTAQKAMLGLTPGNGVAVGSNGQNILNYIRGERSLEGSSTNGYTNAKPFRARKSRQGDIVNSVIWYTGKPASTYALNGYSKFSSDQKERLPMIYVGGNDGMLHGFSAADGSEKLAYVPRGVIPTLKQLAAPAFDEQHKYYVDGSPITGDVDLGTGNISDNGSENPNWRTMLVGTLGNGGKGYFVLDVTNPSDFKADKAQSLVRLDRTRGATEAAPDCTLSTMDPAEKTLCVLTEEEDRDIGHITAAPVLDPNNPMRTTQITRMNDNRWAVVMGNGYNSSNGRPVLLIQYLDTNELVRIPATNDQPGTGNAADNGLSAPRLVDLNSDGRPDIAYAGDNLGNLWKFDLTSDISSNWKVAFGGEPLFTARGPASLSSALREQKQPITAAPTVRANDRTKTLDAGTASERGFKVGGMMVAFGTGRNVTQGDTNDVAVQTLYSVLDNTRYRTIQTTKGSRLEVHPGESSSCSTSSCIPHPKPLGTGVTAAKLTSQSITELSITDPISKETSNFGTISSNKMDWVQHNGWYMDLPAVGERLLKNMEFYDGSNILAMYSQVPAKGSNVDTTVESCESTSVDEERQYLTLINIMDGLAPSIQIIDANGDGFYNSTDQGVARMQTTKGSHTMVTQKDKIADFDSKGDKKLLARMPEQSLRPSWRQLR